MNNFLNQFFACFLIFVFVSSQTTIAYAQKPGRPISGLSTSDDLKITGLANEFTVGYSPGIVMMKINVWGGVGRPGIYHVPIGTDLVSLISYAGGPSAAAELDSTRIRRSVGEKDKSIQVDVDDIVKGKEGAINPDLKVNDIVVIPETKPAVSGNTLAILSVLATVASLAATSLLIFKK